MEDSLDLDVLLEDARPSVPTPLSNNVVKKLNYTHDGMIDIIIANPGISQNQLAAKIGYSVSWVSQIICSDAFQAKLAERTAELVDPAIRLTVEEKLKGILSRSMELLQEKLAKPVEAVSDNLILRSAELSTRALGYGAKDPSPKTEVNVEVRLEQMGENLTTLLHRKKAQSLEGVFDEVKTA